MGYRVAVVGATGNVGREMLNILAERKFPASEVIALASARSQGQEISFGDKRLKVQNLEHFDFTGVDFALMSAGSADRQGVWRKDRRPAASWSIIRASGATTPMCRWWCRR
jgi:aspartate-semialdehyde dehydrogenase